MTHFAGLDVSVNETSICIVDDEGRVVLEAKVKTEPVAIISALAAEGASTVASVSRPALFHNGFTAR
jgi:hypothetical protein